MQATRRSDIGHELANPARCIWSGTGSSRAVTATRWKHAFYFFASPGFLAERMDVFLARGLKPGEAQPEDDERIKVKFFSLNTALRMCLNGKIHDAKTMTAIFWYSVSRRR